MKIYGFPTFNVMKVLLTAEQLNLDYDYVALDPAKGEHKTPEYLAIHPLGMVPALVHDGHCFAESNAICRYLACLKESSLYSGDAKQKAIIDQWVDMLSQHIGRWLAVFFYNEVVKKYLLQQPADAEAMAEAQGFLNQQLPVIEQQLSQTSFLAGETMTIADTIAFAYLQIHESTSVSLDQYPHLLTWYKGIRQGEACQRAMSHFPETISS